MKRIIAIAILAVVCTSVFAQRIPSSAKYRDLKDSYAPGNYIKSDSDPYQVFWIGLESFAAPGLGQLIMKETGRGWAFVGATAIVSSVGSSAAQKFLDLAEKDANGDWSIPEENKDKAKKYLLQLSVAGLAQLGISIWSCVDAVKIAKVKNQYYQDARRGYGISATMYPSVDFVQTGSGVAPAAGMTLAVKF